MINFLANPIYALIAKIVLVVGVVGGAYMYAYNQGKNDTLLKIKSEELVKVTKVIEDFNVRSIEDYKKRMEDLERKNVELERVEGLTREIKTLVKNRPKYFECKIDEDVKVKINEAIK